MDQASESVSIPLGAPDIEPTPISFISLGVEPDICAALTPAGITAAFPIQEMCIPLALAGQDLIGQAKTGTGKTLGFGIPLIQTIDQSKRDPASPQALVVVPTRELCLQVAEDLAAAGSQRETRVVSVYGGRAYEPQVEALERGVDILVGTPGRLLDLARQRKVRLDRVRALVLDEADEMLDMGFLPDVEKIVAQLPTQRQTMLFSATMPGRILNLARRYMTNPTHIRATDPTSENATVDTIEQHVWRTHPLDKPELLTRILQATDRGRTIIFTRTKRAAQQTADDLVQRGFNAGSVHGDLNQNIREKALRSFRDGGIDVLVATDVAARGIDVEGVTHVVNYSCPEDDKTYLHRIGRTGRAGASGVAVTLVDWGDIARWKMINKELGLAFAEPIETYSTSEHIYTGLGIPQSAGSRIGPAPTSPASASPAPKSPEKPGRGTQSRGDNGRSRQRKPKQPPAETRQAPRQRRRTRSGLDTSA